MRGRTVDIVLEGQDSGFGVWLGKRLHEFYRTYIDTQNKQDGD